MKGKKKGGEKSSFVSSIRYYTTVVAPGNVIDLFFPSPHVFTSPWMAGGGGS